MTGGAGSPAPLDAGSLIQLTLSLALVVALIFAVSWLLKRLKFNGSRGSRCMEVLDELSLGPRERLLLVRVGESQVLLGVGNGAVNSLTPLSVPVALSAANEGGFAGRMREVMRGVKSP